MGALEKAVPELLKVPNSHRIVKIIHEHTMRRDAELGACKSPGLKIDLNHPDAFRAKVFLNGRELTTCIRADEDAGEAECYATDSCGVLLPAKEGQHLTEILRGVVKIIIPS